MKTVFALLALLFGANLWAVESVKPLDTVDIDVFDRNSLRRGARFYTDYCIGCHSLKHLRYSRLAEDLRISDEQLEKEFLFGDQKKHDSIVSAMKPEDGEKWFGVAPPDLSLKARSRGPDWIYSYLRSYYVDPTKPTGVNNLVYKGTAMPNVLSELQGPQKAVLARRDGADVIEGLDPIRPGRMSVAEFDRNVADLVNFLAYAAEPAQTERLRLGKYVILFLLILAVVTYKLKKEYWKDIT